MDKYHPGYFGKVGMRYFHLNRNKYHCPVINVEKLPTLISDKVRAECAGKEIVPVIDVTQHGYGKVLAKGRLPKQAFIVKTRYVSHTAEKKIKENGGVVVLTA
ncbi:60S ribosomal protein L27A [Entomophthora muscae]|uniref:60S ribosomal protein L27A n=1 Tax=Entomophthora muscae TaxID=34485 RepID=A0ACC2SG38_9FUNG|nr:60S ribosomal protein L27A [Entomophthora muscae]